MMKTMSQRRFLATAACLAATMLLLSGCSGKKEAPAAKGETVATADSAKCPHGAPKELCFICDPSLREKGRLWCEEHKRYEDRCWECHPELRDPNRPYCEKHFLYEDEDFLCHPDLLKKGARSDAEASRTFAAGKSPAGSPALLCKEHRVPEQECGICHPELLAKKQPGEGLKVRLPSAESAAKAGITVEQPGVDRMEQGIECLAELTFNQNKLAEITPLVEGVVRFVAVDLGSHVHKGELLARLASQGMSEAQSAYLSTRAEEELRAKDAERQRNLRVENISSDKDVQEAEAAHKNAAAALRQAWQHLKVLGFTEEQIEGLGSGRAAPEDLEIRAPFAGEIVERKAVQGALAEVGKKLFTLADTSTLWAMVSIPESQLSRARVGQSVQLTVESLPGQRFTGRLTWLPVQIDERTRMARGRAEVDNKEGRLKAQMFARALILTGASEHAIVIPESALQKVSGRTVVFVRSGEDLFEARAVTVGARRGGRVEILEGLKPEERVVVSGGFALKSQFLISKLGAGCVD